MLIKFVQVIMIEKFINCLEGDFSNLLSFENQSTEIFDKRIRTFEPLDLINFEFESNYAKEVCRPITVTVDLLRKRIPGSE